MATVTKSNVRFQKHLGGTPYGNACKHNYTFATDASGVLVGGDQATALIATDVVNLGILPAGLELHDALAIVSDAFTALTTADIGFAYVDGVDDTDVPQDADYFGALFDVDESNQ